MLPPRDWLYRIWLAPQEFSHFDDPAAWHAALRDARRTVTNHWLVWLAWLMLFPGVIAWGVRGGLALGRFCQLAPAPATALALAGGALAFLLVVNVTFVVGRRSIRRSLRASLRRRGIPMCVVCGYNLRNLPQRRCPECGHAFDAEGRPRDSAVDVPWITRAIHAVWARWLVRREHAAFPDIAAWHDAMSEARREGRGHWSLWMLIAAVFPGYIVCVSGLSLVFLRCGLEWIVLVSALIYLILFTVVAVYAWRRARRSLWRQLRAAGVPTCVSCGYSLCGLDSPRCPECGATRG